MCAATAYFPPDLYPTAALRRMRFKHGVLNPLHSIRMCKVQTGGTTDRPTAPLPTAHYYSIILFSCEKFGSDSALHHQPLSSLKIRRLRLFTVDYSRLACCDTHKYFAETAYALERPKREIRNQTESQGLFEASSRDRLLGDCIHTNTF